MADDVEGSGPVTYELEQGAEWRFELQEPGEAIAIRVSLVQSVATLNQHREQLVSRLDHAVRSC